jgi:enamine deaminase RidA (YjgF/YER057c/UK114 family)
MSEIERKLETLEITLPKVQKPVAAFVPAKTVGNLIFTSGQDCRIDGVLKYEGKLGSDLTIEQGYDAARQTMINLLAVLKGKQPKHIVNKYYARG